MIEAPLRVRVATVSGCLRSLYLLRRGVARFAWVRRSARGRCRPAAPPLGRPSAVGGASGELGQRPAARPRRLPLGRTAPGRPCARPRSASTGRRLQRTCPRPGAWPTMAACCAVGSACITRPPSVKTLSTQLPRLWLFGLPPRGSQCSFPGSAVAD